MAKKPQQIASTVIQVVKVSQNVGSEWEKFPAFGTIDDIGRAHQVTIPQVGEIIDVKAMVFRDGDGAVTKMFVFTPSTWLTWEDEEKRDELSASVSARARDKHLRNQAAKGATEQARAASKRRAEAKVVAPATTAPKAEAPAKPAAKKGQRRTSKSKSAAAKVAASSAPAQESAPVAPFWEQEPSDFDAEMALSEDYAARESAAK